MSLLSVSADLESEERTDSSKPSGVDGGEDEKEEGERFRQLRESFGTDGWISDGWQ